MYVNESQVFGENYPKTGHFSFVHIEVKRLFIVEFPYYLRTHRPMAFRNVLLIAFKGIVF